MDNSNTSPKKPGKHLDEAASLAEKIEKIAKVVVPVIGTLTILATAAWYYVFPSNKEKYKLKPKFEHSILESEITDQGKLKIVGRYDFALTNYNDEAQHITYAEFSTYILSPDKVDGATRAGKLFGPMPHTKCYLKKGEVYDHGWEASSSNMYVDDSKYEEIAPIFSKYEKENFYLNRGGGATGIVERELDIIDRQNFEISLEPGGAYAIQYYVEIFSDDPDRLQHRCSWDEAVAAMPGSI